MTAGRHGDEREGRWFRSDGERDERADDVEPPVEEPRRPSARRKAALQAAAEAVVRRLGASEPRPPAAPLDDAVRTRFEGAYEQRFDGVRVHEDSPRATGSVHALTEGEELHFAPGRYRPGTAEGDRLIAHELSHVVQQRSGAAMPQAFAPVEARGLLEADADRAAERAVAGQRATPRFHAHSSLALHYDSFEHVQIGDAGGGGRKVKLRCGLELTYGQVVALSGDVYSTPDSLMNAPKDEVERMLGILGRQKQEAYRHGGAPTKSEAGAHEREFFVGTAKREWSDYDSTGRPTGKTLGEKSGGEKEDYFDLANDNHEHFAPENLNHWRSEHHIALTLALQSFSDPDPCAKAERRNLALLTDAAACHFLTDAFAAGHLISGADQVGRKYALDYWKEHQAAVIASVAASGPAGPDLAAALPALGEKRLPSLLVKLVHDELNEKGIVVKNGSQQQWIAYGDGKLSSSSIGFQLAAEAVRRSRLEVEEAADHGRSVDLHVAALAPAHVALPLSGGAFVGVEAFARDEVYFQKILRELLRPGPHNRLYRLLEDNAGILLPLAGAKIEQGARAAAMLGVRAAAGGEPLSDETRARIPPSMRLEDK